MAKNSEYVVFRAIYDEETSYESLRVPLAPTTHLNEFRDGAFLRDCYGNIWPVKVDVIGNAMFFFDGWKIFGKQNHLETGDSIVFWKGVHELFDVKILEIDRSNKNGVGRPLLESPFEKAEMQRSSSFAKSYSKRSTSVHHVADKKRICVDHSGDDIFKSPGERPKNPFFVTRVRKERRGTLIVPKEIIIKYKLDLPAEICLKDSDGGEWDCTLNPFKVYGGGWGPLCRAYHINEDDTIICELLISKKKGLYCIQVQVYHEGNST